MSLQCILTRPRACTDSFLLIFLSFVVVAVSFYLPHHITTIANRAWWYYAGDRVGEGNEAFQTELKR